MILLFWCVNNLKCKNNALYNNAPKLWTDSAVIKGLSDQSPVFSVPFEPRHEKTGFLHMQKQRHRSASR